MTSIPGVDYAWSHPGGSALKAAGKRFAARYLSNDADKNIARAEADDLAQHEVSSVVVWESTAKRPLAGRAAGISDAQVAQRQATAAGMPSGRPIYFAVDFDATAGQMATVMAYLDGAASVLGRARVGVYGGYDTVRAALDGRHATWAWQTRAWSEGRWDSRAHMRQGATQTIGGVSCDLNTALTTDYGQWMPGRTPNITPQQEDGMADWNTPLTIKKGPWSEKDYTAPAELWLVLGNIKAGRAQDAAEAALAQARANGTTLSTLAGKVDKLATAATPTIDYAKLAAALLAAVKES
ncbi:DUF1906 domain-containing protein [Streptomyces cocklensis]|uniref:Rv2525c-like glycoside hydrolase-like domain-containing protein n=1 Tax=Actinacidiphila cocklensis TaxID=887465 RepID=A0A9W4GQ03_9ACTN|nr:DUF1906 domain-containing protein [Actinacidiphila cocklensis]MDD1057921.1 DUF1906 domain-containing protein [Actinacidiphila cocklensis]CAG6392787.1 conserved hypothetical protein [Actinacidiphila cocklensis]